MCMCVCVHVSTRRCSLRGHRTYFAKKVPAQISFEERVVRVYRGQVVVVVVVVAAVAAAEVLIVHWLDLVEEDWPAAPQLPCSPLVFSSLSLVHCLEWGIPHLQ